MKQQVKKKKRRKVLNKGSYNEKIKRKGMIGKIPYTQIHKIKKTEHIPIIVNGNKKEDRKSIKESRKDKFIERGVYISSEKYNLTGQCDAIEYIRDCPNECYGDF